MATIYITESGITLTRTDGRVVLKKLGVVQEEVPLIHVERIIVLQDASMTTPLVKYALKNGIEVAYLSPQGTYYGHLQGGLDKDVSIRQGQYRMWSEPSSRLEVAKALLAGKLENNLSFLRGLENSKVRVDLSSIEDVLRRIPTARSPDVLQGYDTNSAAAYNQLLRKFIGTVEGSLGGFFALGCGLLYSSLQWAITRVGLDPAMGFLRSGGNGPSLLAYDLMGEWRAMVVDRLLVSMAHSEEAPDLKGFLQRFEDCLEAEVLHPRLGYRTSLRRSIELQVRHFADVMVGKEKTYQPLPITGN